MPAQLWERAVDHGVGRASAGVYGSHHRAVEALFRSPAKGACAVSGHDVPVELVDGDSEAGVISARPDVHEVARLVSRGARTVYADRDPEVVARSRALLAGVEGVVAVAGDVRCPAGIAADPGICGVIDFSRPVGVLLVAVLHFVADNDGPRAAVARLRDLMARGSYLVLSHVTSDGSGPPLVAAIRDVYVGAAPVVLRTARQVQGFFDGFRLVAPWLVDAPEWRPAPGYVREPARA